MDDERRPEKKPRSGLPIRLLVYPLVFPLVWLALRTLAPEFAGLPTCLASIVVSFFVILVAVSQLPDLEAGLKKLLKDLGDLVEELRQFVTQARLQSVQQLIGQTVRIWVLALLRPVQFAAWQRERTVKDPGLQSVLGTIASLTLLLFLNACLTGIPNDSYTSLSNWLFNLVAFCVAPALLIAYDLRRESRNRPPLKRLGTPGFVWFFMAVPWVVVPYGLHPAFGVRILALSCLLGLVVGCMVGTLVNIKASSTTLGTIGLVLFIGFLLASGYSQVPQPASLRLEVESDPLLGVIYSSLEESGYSTLYDDAYSAETDDGEYHSSYLMSLPLAVGILASLGGWVGIFFGQRGIILYLFEVPVFGLAWLLILLKIQAGSTLLTALITVDEWRAWRLPGESDCYLRLARSDPDQVITALAPQISQTPRRHTALRTMAQVMNRLDANTVLAALSPLLPFSQYEDLTPWPIPPMVMLVTQTKGPEFETILKQRRSVYKDLLETLPHGLQETHQRLIGVLNTIAQAHWENVEQAREEAGLIASGLRYYPDAPYAHGLFLLATAVESSLNTTDLRDIANCMDDWLALKNYSASDVQLEYLVELVGVLLGFVKTVEEYESGESKTLQQAAAHAIVLEDRLEQESAGIITSLGLRELDLVTKHWRRLLSEALRQCDPTPEP